MTLTRKYGYPILPDAQCGCWGFKGKYLREMNKRLKAWSFDIELDILEYFLYKKYNSHTKFYKNKKATYYKF